MSHRIQLFVAFNLVWPEQDGLGQRIRPCFIRENRAENTNRRTGDNYDEARATARCAKTVILDDQHKPEIVVRGSFATPSRISRRR